MTNPIYKTPILVTGSLTPTGTQNVNVISPNPLPVTGTLVITEGVVATSVVTRVLSSITSQTLVTMNTARQGLLLYNDSTATQYVKFGPTATNTDFTVILVPKVFYEVAQPIFIGQIDVISSSTNGAIQVTELS